MVDFKRYSEDWEEPCRKCKNNFTSSWKPSEDKLEKREEQKNMIKISDMRPGDEFVLGDIEWTILDTDYQVGVFVLAKEPIGQRAFDGDNCNDWRKASARKYLNEKWRKDFEEKAKVDLFGFNRNLTSDDGLNDYGTCFDYVSLITCDEYRRYRDFISNKSDWWWTITPWCTPNSGNSHYVRRVGTDGSLNNNNACYGRVGLAPALVLPPDKKILEKKGNRMSSISKQVKELREWASLNEEGFSDFTAYLLNHAADTIEALSEKCRVGWIPVSEKLPKESGKYLVTFGGMFLTTGKDFYTTEEDAKRNFEEPEECVGWRSRNVIAWMPLPEPYEPQESEE